MLLATRYSFALIICSQMKKPTIDVADPIATKLHKIIRWASLNIA